MPQRGRHAHPDFSRPELTTRWEKISGNAAVRIGGVMILVAGTGSLVVAAVVR